MPRLDLPIWWKARPCTKQSPILRGEYRKLYPEEIGSIVRVERYRTGLKRLSLATEAAVSEKTIERLERGDAVSVKTYRRVAAVLGLPDSTFLVRHYIPRGAWIDRRNLLDSKRFLHDYYLVKLHRATDTSVILDLFRTVGFLIVEEEIADEHLEAAALLNKRLVQSIGVGAVKLWSAAEAARVRHARGIAAAVEKFEALGYAVAVGRVPNYAFADGTPIHLAVCLVARRPPWLAPLESDQLWLLRGLRATRAIVISNGPARTVPYSPCHKRQIRSRMRQLGGT